MDSKLRALLVEARRAADAAAEECTAKLLDLGAVSSSPVGARSSSREVPSADVARELISQSVSAAFFRVFTVIDGVGDPEGWEGDVWTGFTLVPRNRDEPFLHDAFMEVGE
jgi:hypothetical protein